MFSELNTSFDISGKLFLGIVEDNKDPNRKGRIKVRVQSVFDTIPLEDIPYASPFASLSGKEYQLPQIGKLVNILFLNNDMYDPYYIFSENYNINLQNKLKLLSEDEYINFVALLFDHRTQIYSDNNALTLDYLYNKITIDKSQINLELKDNTGMIKIGTKSASQSSVLGDHFFEWLDKFIAKLLEPTSLTGNIGAPILKPDIDSLLTEYQNIRDTFLSKIVKVVDNNSVDELN
jgi:hypothetical protein